MKTVADYLEITPAEARRQWHDVQRRPAVSPGTRQVFFSPVETLMCLAASIVVNHRRFGGSTSQHAPSPVPQLAHLFKRTNASILAKMANLDGSRPNGARYEVEVASVLLGTPGRLGEIYRVILASARDVGIESPQIPDFLDMEDRADELFLLGQDELEGEDIESTVQSASEAWNRQLLNANSGPSDHSAMEAITERLLIGAVRVGQHRFAREVLANHGHSCAFCGLMVSSTERRHAHRMLVASHIKPWRVSTSKERLDARNGLSACPTHDVAFDTGLLTVNGGLRIHVRADLAEVALTDSAMGGAFGRPPLAERIRLPDGATPPGSAYLQWHQQNVYQGSLSA